MGGAARAARAPPWAPVPPARPGSPPPPENAPPARAPLAAKMLSQLPPWLLGAAGLAGLLLLCVPTRDLRELPALKVPRPHGPGTPARAALPSGPRGWGPGNSPLACRGRGRDALSAPQMQPRGAPGCGRTRGPQVPQGRICSGISQMGCDGAGAWEPPLPPPVALTVRGCP